MVPEVAPVPLEYYFCPCQRRWYWSVDGTHWQREDVYIIQDGVYKGRRPCNADLEILSGLMRVKDSYQCQQTEQDCRQSIN